MARISYKICDKCKTRVEEPYRHLQENNGYGWYCDFCKPCWLKFIDWMDNEAKE